MVINVKGDIAFVDIFVGNNKSVVYLALVHNS